MGRPRITSAMVNGRVTAEQMEWLAERADELGGNLSAALRQAITDARLLEMARQDFKAYRAENPGFNFGSNDEGASWGFDLIISGIGFSETDDLELRREEGSEE